MPKQNRFSASRLNLHQSGLGTHCGYGLHLLAIGEPVPLGKDIHRVDKALTSIVVVVVVVVRRRRQIVGQLGQANVALVHVRRDVGEQ